MGQSKAGIYFGLLLSILLFQVLQAQDPVFTITAEKKNASLGKKITILEDKTGKLTFDDVRSLEFSKHFYPSKKNEPSFGFTSSAYWVKLTVQNPLQKTVDWYLEISYPLLDHIDLYIPGGEGQYKLEQTGDRLPFDSRELDYRNFIFHLSENAKSGQTYYLRFKTSSSMNFPLNYWTQDALLEKIASEQIILGVYYGAILIMIIYSIILFIGFKDKSYIYYVFLLITWGLAQLALNGLAFQYIWSNWIWWANSNVPFLIFCTNISIIIFSRSVLETKKHTPLGEKILKIENIILNLAAVSSIILPYSIMIKFATASALATIIILIIIGTKIVIKKVHRAAYYFMIAFGLFFLGVILFSLKTFGILPSNFLTNWSIQIGSFAYVVLLSVAVQDRINKEKREKLLAQKEALDNQEKLVETLKESERILEEKVHDRTKELNDKNISLRSRTEELQNSHQSVTMLGEVGQKITATFELEEIMTMIYNSLKASMDVSIFALGLYNKDKRKINFVYYLRNSKRMPPVPVLTDSEYELSAWCIKNRQPIFINDFDKEKSKYVPKDVVIELDTYGQSLIYMPLTVEDRIIGVATAQSFKKNAYTAYHLDIVRTLVAYGAIALDNASAYQQIKKANEELKKAQKQLIYSEKMASLGQMTAGIAHEIKNPLNFVTNFSLSSADMADELMEELKKVKGHLDVSEYNYLEEIVRDIQQNARDISDNSKRADSIVQSMMLHTRGEKGELRSVDINFLLDENVNLGYHGFRARDINFNITIEKNYDENVGTLEVIHQDLGRVFLNIINNACYALRQKQQMEGEGYSPTLSVVTLNLDNYIEIRIQDNGPGMPPEVSKKIFEPFFTTKPSGEGNTGLGMSISYDIIEHGHKGKLEVSSKPGESTEFRIKLPKDQKAL